MSAGLALTFDDTYVDEWTAALPLFKKYDARATFYVSHFPHLGGGAINELHQLRRAGHEIGFHSVNHKNALKEVAAKGLDAYEADEITPGIQVMSRRGFAPRSFSYPFNKHSDAIDERLSRRFSTLRAHAPTVEEALHPFSGNRVLRARGCDLFAGKNFIRSLYEVLGYLERAKDSGKVLVLYGHGIDSGPSDHHNLTRFGLEAILAAAATFAFKFVTASEMA